MLQINIPLSHALTRIEKHAEHNRWLKSRISAIRKNVLSGQSLALAMKNCGYDFPSKSCVNNLLLNSEREDSVASMALYADRWLEEAKRMSEKAALLLLLYQVCWYFSSSSIWSVPFTASVTC